MGGEPGLAVRPVGGQFPPFSIRRLIWWAELEFRKLKRLPEGGTLGDAFKAFRRQAGKPHPDDKVHVTPPESLLYLYNWFWELAQSRPLGPEGISLPIPNTELRAWCELAGVQLQGFELAVLRALDGTFLKIAAEKHV